MTALSALAALVPSIGVGLLFWLAVRSMIRADRTERAAMARLDAAETERRRLAAESEISSTSSGVPRDDV